MNDKNLDLILYKIRKYCKDGEEIAEGAKEVIGESNIILRRIADDVPMQIIEQNPFWHHISRFRKKVSPIHQLNQ